MDRTAYIRSSASAAFGLVMAFSLFTWELQAQCPTTIATFPYQEGFEGSAAWTSGGTGNDWAWGTPSKATINAAGGGSKCWITGGLSGSSYTNGAQSWLAGPCFNFTNVAYPWISFKIFWECERDYDGMALQYSTNAGVTWINVGAFGSPAHCLNANWYNTQYISNLNSAVPQQGWSGRIGPTNGACLGGSGSGGWVTASHCLPALAGLSSVKFRFVFGAGTTCNSYDGIAIDDVFVGNAPANQAGFTFACSGNTLDFTSTAPLCPSGYSWDFGDPASGSANTSTLTNPSHTFPGPGTYQVTMTVNGPCNAPSTIVRNVSVLGLEFVVTEPGCGGGDGSIVALVGGTSVPLNVIWTPGGQTTVVLTGLDAGVYGITVTAQDACPVQGSVELLAGSSPMEATAQVTDISCNGELDGVVSISVTGGAEPYTYVWDPPIGGTSSISGLGVGSYSCTVTDAAGCTATAEGSVAEPDLLEVVVAGNVDICRGEGFELEAEVTGGTGPFDTIWSPDGPDVSPQVSTDYEVLVTDANGCSAGPAFLSVSVSGPDVPGVDLDASTGCAPLCVSMLGSSTSDVIWEWDLGDGDTADEAEVTHCYGPGTYSVTLTVTDDEGCSNTLTLGDAITAQSAPTAAFIAQPEVVTISDAGIRFLDGSTDATSWVWDFGDGSGPVEGLNDVFHTFGEVDCYEVQLVVGSELGCQDSATLTVCVEDDFAFYAPNAFTPDGDGINDEFLIATTVASPSDYELIIHDRWGQVVQVLDRVGKGWDGENVPVGVYVWHMRLRDTMGKIQVGSGHVTLIR